MRRWQASEITECSCVLTASLGNACKGLWPSATWQVTCSAHVRPVSAVWALPLQGAPLQTLAFFAGCLLPVFAAPMQRAFAAVAHNKHRRHVWPDALTSVRALPAGVQRGLSYPHTPPRVRSGGYLPSLAAIKAERVPHQGEESPTGHACHGLGDAGVGGFAHPSLPSSPGASRSGQLAAAPPLRPGRSSAPEPHVPGAGGGGPAAPRPRALAVGAAPMRICVRRHASAPPVRSLEELLGAYLHLRLAPHLSFDEVAAAAASAAHSAAAAVISAAQYEHAMTAVRALPRTPRSPPTARSSAAPQAGPVDMLLTGRRACLPASLMLGTWLSPGGHLSSSPVSAARGCDLIAKISYASSVDRRPCGDAPRRKAPASSLPSQSALDVRREATSCGAPAGPPARQSARMAVRPEPTRAGAAGSRPARGSGQERVRGVPARAAQVRAGATPARALHAADARQRARAHFSRPRPGRPLVEPARAVRRACDARRTRPSGPRRSGSVRAA